MSSRTASRIGIALIGAVCLAASAHAALKTGDVLPPLESQGLEGQVPNLAGKVVLLDFWASWCGPCKKSFPELDKLYGAYKDRGFVILGVSVDEKATDMRSFLDSHPVGFPVARDRDQALVSIFEIESMPTSFLIDRTGKVRSVHNGFRGDKTVSLLSEEIESLLNERMP